MSAATQTGGRSNYQKSTTISNFNCIKLHQTSVLHNETINFSVKEELNGKENC